MPLLSLQNISRKFDKTIAVADVSLDVDRGEFFGLLGPSGCGKTTTLRMIAGLEQPDAGVIEFEGDNITNLPAEKRGFGMVFQNYALFPHLNVLENVAFGLRARHKPKSEIIDRVRNALELVQLPGYEKRRVDELSGGQQQRVAIARAIAIEPALLLFDEPLSNLDVALREETRGELRELVTRLGLTAVYVTHDQEEAFALCDRISVMGGGRLLQTGRPRDLYEHPSQLSEWLQLDPTRILSLLDRMDIPRCEQCRRCFVPSMRGTTRYCSRDCDQMETAGNRKSDPRTRRL